MTIFSASEIKNYTECARKRYYSSRSLLALKPSKPNMNMFLGKRVHEMLDYYYTKGQTRKECEPFKLDAMTSDQFEKAGCLKTFECIHEMYQARLEEDLSKYTVLDCEHEFELIDWPIKDVKYHGQIDMIVQEKETGKIFFFEHKTARDFRPEIYSRFDVQLHIYAFYGQKYCDENNLEWGGMILNEIKKAKTERGYAEHRMYYLYSPSEMMQFFCWIKEKTKGAVNSFHEPCNSYMTCKMCPFQDVCLDCGYDLLTREAILSNQKYVNEDGEPAYLYNPREEIVEEE